MTNEQLLSAIGDIRDDFILEGATVPSAKNPRSRSYFLKWGAAACLVLAIGAGIWQMADRPVQPPSTVKSQSDTTVQVTTQKATAAVTVPESFSEPMTVRFPIVTVNEIVYSAVSETDAELGEKLCEIMLSSEFGDVNATVYAVKDTSPEEAVILQFEGSATNYLYQSAEQPTEN